MKELVTVGWREWVRLPDLHIDAIKAKVDTGAKTCALHAFYVTPFEENSEKWVRFGIHPNQDESETAVDCVARLSDQREVTDSGGHVEQRYVILTSLVVGDEEFDIEVTLTDRENMRYRMLLGRNALNNRFLVNPVESHLLGEFSH